MNLNKLMEEFDVDIDLEDSVLGLLVELEIAGDSRLEELEKKYYTVRDHDWSAQSIVLFARSFYVPVSDSIIPLLTKSADAHLDVHLIASNLACRTVFRYVEAHHPDLYGRLQTFHNNE